MNNNQKFTDQNLYAKKKKRTLRRTCASQNMSNYNKVPSINFIL